MCLWFFAVLMKLTNSNYVASAFILLTFKDCISAWHRMGWYGHISIALALAFFRSGGGKYLKSQLPPSAVTSKSKSKEPKAVKPQVSPPPEPTDDDMTWVKHALDESARGIGAGAGVDPDGGLVQKTVMESGRTSRADSPF